MHVPRKYYVDDSVPSLALGTSCGLFHVRICPIGSLISQRNNAVLQYQYPQSDENITFPFKPIFTCNKEDFLPVLQLVIIESSVKVNQHSGSGSMLLDCEEISVLLPIAAAKRLSLVDHGRLSIPRLVVVWQCGLLVPQGA
jgi:hypothetical protein